MQLISKIIYDKYAYGGGNIDEQTEKLYPVDRIYVARLVRFISHRPYNIDKLNYVQAIPEPNFVLLKHETGGIFTDIETGDNYTWDTISAVKYDRDYRLGKLYVSKQYCDLLKHRCYNSFKELDLLDQHYLTRQQLRKVLDDELTWENGYIRHY